MSLFDEDEMECEYCGHIGLMFNVRYVEQNIR